MDWWRSGPRGRSRGNRGVMATLDRALSGAPKTVTWTAVMDAHFCEYSKSFRAVGFKQVN